MTLSPAQHLTRRQLTLFISGGIEQIEKIRKQFNPVQHKLISAHVTLCREDEIIQIEKVIQNILVLKWSDPLKITFDPVYRFEGGKGVWLPSSTENTAFHELRKAILKGLNDNPRKHQPHLTLMHPRNSTCTDKIFDQIKAYALPTELFFDKISLVEQNNGAPWKTISEYRITPQES